MKYILSLVILSLCLLAMTEDMRGEYYPLLNKHRMDIYTCTGYIDGYYSEHPNSKGIEPAFLSRCRALHYPLFNNYMGWTKEEKTFHQHFVDLWKKGGIWQKSEEQDHKYVISDTYSLSQETLGR